MMRWIATSLLILSLLTLMLPTRSTDLQKKNSLLTRMFGFHYPLDSDSNYTVGWITTFDEFEIEKDFQKIRSNFLQVNLLRIPIGWEDMNNPILLTQMETVIELGKEYGFKFMFVLMDRVSGWGDTPTPRNMLESEHIDHQNRISLVVNHFKAENQIYAWALGNELNVFQEVVYEWYEQMIPHLEDLDSDTPICTSFYPLGPNATTVSRAASLVGLGLDFIEFHYYPNSTDQIESEIDQLTAYVNVPIFLSEFSVADGLNHSTTKENVQILNATVQTFQKRPNVIGLSYYRWSNDNRENFTIWNSTAQTPKPEAEALSISASFLQRSPYPCLETLQSNQTIEHTIDDPSFETLTEWPDESGWVKGNNSTFYELVRTATSTIDVSGQTRVDLTNCDFEDGDAGWNPEESDNHAIDSDIAYHENKSLKMWIGSSSKSQMQHSVSDIQAGYVYLLEGWVKVTETNNGGAAFIQLAFRDYSTSWIANPETEKVARVTDWVAIQVAAVAPANVTDALINCRVNGNGGNVTAYFDYLSIWEVAPAAYDGHSYMIAFGEELDSEWNVVQLSQNFEFSSPPEDAKRIWTFSVRLATALSPEYDTDWKGAFIQLAFTTENSDEWLTWFSSEYLSSNHNWTDINVLAIPPPNAKGLRMIVKVASTHYGVLFIDDAHLTSRPALIPKQLVVPLISEQTKSYEVSLLYEGINGTIADGIWILGDCVISDANASYAGSSFGTVLNGTSRTVSFTFTILTCNIWSLIGSVLGIVGFCLVIVSLLIIIRTLKQKKPERLVLSLVCLAIGASLILIWILNL